MYINYKKYNEWKPIFSIHYDKLSQYQKKVVRRKLGLKQDYKCAICGIEESKMSKKLALDHDHITGQVRGLLCSDCNFILGFAKDNIKSLERAITYLKKGKATYEYQKKNLSEKMEQIFDGKKIEEEI